MFGRAGGERRGLAAGGARGPARGQRSLPRSRPLPPPRRLLSNFPRSSPPCQRPPAASRAAPLLFSSFSFFFSVSLFSLLKDPPKVSLAPPVSLCKPGSLWAPAALGRARPRRCQAGPAVPVAGLAPLSHRGSVVRGARSPRGLGCGSGECPGAAAAPTLAPQPGQPARLGSEPGWRCAGTWEKFVLLWWNSTDVLAAFECLTRGCYFK